MDSSSLRDYFSVTIMHISYEKLHKYVYELVAEENPEISVGPVIFSFMAVYIEAMGIKVIIDETVTRI